MTDEDPTGFHEVVIRENTHGERNLGYTPQSEPPSSRDATDFGWGDDLKTPAFDAVREAIDLEAHEIGEHVATIHYDLDVWEFTIEFHVDADRSVF